MKASASSRVSRWKSCFLASGAGGGIKLADSTALSIPLTRRPFVLADGGYLGDGERMEKLARILWITIYTEGWEVIQQQKTAKEKPETSQAPWQQEAWKQLQEEFSKSAQEREAVESAENQTENHIKSNVDYASYLVMTASPHIIVDSNGFRYIVVALKILRRRIRLC